MADTLTEGGLRDHRIDYQPEGTAGTMPEGGTFEPVSEQYTTFDWGADAGITGRRAIGNVDPEQFDRGPEAHDLTVSFYLQGTIESDTPIYDGMARDSDNLIPNTYTWVDREKFNSGGVAGEGYRTYTVAEGWKPGNPTLPGDPGSGEPINVDLAGNAEKIRSYQIDQPSATIANINVTGAAATVIVQDDTEGTTKVTHTSGTTYAAFTGDNIDAVYLPKPASSSVTVGEGSPAVNYELVTIQGSDAYDNLEGDKGVPYAGSRSATNLHGTEYQSLVGDTIQWGGSDLAFGINSVELSVTNNLEQVPRQGKKRQRIFAGNRDIELTTTVYGNNESHDKIMSHLQKESGTVTWTLDSNTVVVNGAVLTDVGNKTIEQGQAFMELDNTFSGTSITINGVKV